MKLPTLLNEGLQIGDVAAAFHGLVKYQKKKKVCSGIGLQIFILVGQDVKVSKSEQLLLSNILENTGHLNTKI